MIEGLVGGISPEADLCGSLRTRLFDQKIHLQGSDEGFGTNRDKARQPALGLGHGQGPGRDAGFCAKRLIDGMGFLGKSQLKRFNLGFIGVQRGRPAPVHKDRGGQHRPALPLSGMGDDIQNMTVSLIESFGVAGRIETLQGIVIIAGHAHESVSGRQPSHGLCLSVPGRSHIIGGPQGKNGNPPELRGIDLVHGVEACVVEGVAVIQHHGRDFERPVVEDDMIASAAVRSDFPDEGVAAAVEACQVQALDKSREIAHDVVEKTGVGMGRAEYGECSSCFVEVFSDHVAVEGRQCFFCPVQVSQDIGHEAVEFGNPEKPDGPLRRRDKPGLRHPLQGPRHLQHAAAAAGVVVGARHRVAEVSDDEDFFLRFFRSGERSRQGFEFRFDVLGVDIRLDDDFLTFLQHAFEHGALKFGDIESEAHRFAVFPTRPERGVADHVGETRPDFQGKVCQNTESAALDHGFLHDLGCGRRGQDDFPADIPAVIGFLADSRSDIDQFGFDVGGVRMLDQGQGNLFKGTQALPPGGNQP